MVNLKEVFFNQLFKKNVKRYKNSIEYKYVDFTLICTNEKLQNFFDFLYYKYKSSNLKNNYNDFMSECIYWSYVAIQRFKIDGCGTWEGIIAGTDKKNIGRLITNIKITLENEMIKFVNDDVIYTTEKKKHVRFKFELSSLDELIIGLDEQEADKINFISENNKFWSTNYQFYQSFFTKWFLQNKERILCKTQVKLLENLAKCYHVKGKNSYTEEDCYKYTGVPSYKINTRLGNIKKRVLKAWEVENPLGQKSQLQMEKEHEIHLWNDLMSIVKSVDCEKQNVEISEWILKHFNDTKVLNLIYDNLAGSDCIKIVSAFNNKAEIPSKILYKVVALVEARLKELELKNTTKTPFHKKKSEGNWNKDKHKKYAQYLKSFKQNPCWWYDSKGDLIAEINWVGFKHSSIPLKMILPTGVTIIENKGIS